MHSATIPKRPAELLKLIEIPVDSSRTSREILVPRSPLPSGESTSRNRSEVTNPVTNVTATTVESERDGLRSFANSALITLIITHQSFQKMYLLMLDVLVLKS